ncbi:MAG: hypothetical protein PF517_18725 [Salinivirgaceae bacterium]|jgi:hypothetical protein|nr:hypothetical protein [Salinivirgaceae bacterium]
MYKYLFIMLITLAVITTSCSSPDKTNIIETNADAQIFPDYSSITFPCNIAPPNFIIEDSADNYFVELNAKNSRITIKSKSNDIQIPKKSWSKLLKNNKGEDFTIDIYTESVGKWHHFNTIKNTIANEGIDSYVVYRFINAAHILWNKMGIYQRNIENFEVSPIMDNSLTNNNCMHCHSFAANNSNNFMFHMRGKLGGTIIYQNNELKFVNTKTDHTISAGGYPSWHPSAKFIAFSTNKINQRFHAVKEKYAFVFDRKSDIILYDVELNEVQAIPALSQPEFENMPTWSPDGKYLYFLSSKPYDADSIDYQDIKYDLKRISFDADTKKWGTVENIILSDSIEKSVTFPRVSPDNKYVVFCLADYGYFNVYTESSDIAIFNLETREIIKPDINTNNVESYPSWSSNGKWIMFNSKRADGISSRPYFSYFDKGIAHKPFILPQESANWNFDELFNINRPELVSSKVPLTPQKILKLVQEMPENVGFDESSLENIQKDSTAKSKADDTFDFDQ